jgi:hypothetical protein
VSPVRYELGSYIPEDDVLQRPQSFLFVILMQILLKRNKFGEVEELLNFHSLSATTAPRLMTV